MFKIPPPNQLSDISRESKVTHPWMRWFNEVFRFLKATVLSNEGTSSTASGASGGDEPYVTEDGNDSPVPYTPAGFIIVEIDGAQKKIPFFDL